MGEKTYEDRQHEENLVRISEDSKKSKVILELTNRKLDLMQQRDHLPTSIKTKEEELSKLEFDHKLKLEKMNKDIKSLKAEKDEFKETLDLQIKGINAAVDALVKIKD